MPIDYHYEEVELTKVLDYYAKDFKPPAGKIVRTETFVDVAKGRVLFRLLVDTPHDQRPG